MVDYVRTLGSQDGSRMMIRDLGTVVEFWVKSGSAGTYHFAMPFGWTVNGSTGSATIPYNYPWPGQNYPTQGPWVKCKSFTVTQSQTVTFRIGSTGTYGLNGPTSFSVALQRSTVRIKHGGVWKLGTVYIKHGGVWKLAKPYIKHGGQWKACV